MLLYDICLTGKKGGGILWFVHAVSWYSISGDSYTWLNI